MIQPCRRLLGKPAPTGLKANSQPRDRPDRKTRSPWMGQGAGQALSQLQQPVPDAPQPASVLGCSQCRMQGSRGRGGPSREAGWSPPAELHPWRRVCCCSIRKAFPSRARFFGVLLRWEGGRRLFLETSLLLLQRRWGRPRASFLEAEPSSLEASGLAGEAGQGWAILQPSGKFTSRRINDPAFPAVFMARGPPAGQVRAGAGLMGTQRDWSGLWGGLFVFLGGIQTPSWGKARPPSQRARGSGGSAPFQGAAAHGRRRLQTAAPWDLNTQPDTQALQSSERLHRLTHQPAFAER